MRIGSPTRAVETVGGVPVVASRSLALSLSLPLPLSLDFSPRSVGSLAPGLRKTDLDLLHGRGGAMGEIMHRAQPRSTLFTGSRRVAERLARDHNGKVFLEDAGFDWKILVRARCPTLGRPSLSLD